MALPTPGKRSRRVPQSPELQFASRSSSISTGNWSKNRNCHYRSRNIPKRRNAALATDDTANYRYFHASRGCTRWKLCLQRRKTSRESTTIHVLPMGNRANRRGSGIYQNTSTFYHLVSSLGGRPEGWHSCKNNGHRTRTQGSAGNLR